MRKVELSSTQRWLSLAELVAGAAIVIGHNVYHVIPNEVPILFVLGLISFRWRDGSWAEMGLSWPIAWRRTVLFAIAAAALRILLGGLVVDPLTSHFWPPFWIRALLQRPVGHCGFWNGGTHPWGGISFVRAQSLGLHSGAWIH